MSDRIAVMRDGRVEQVAEPRTMYERPQSAFVAEFIGTSNLLVIHSGVVEAGVLSASLSNGQRLTALHPTSPTRPVAGTDVQITVRPERIALHHDLPSQLGPQDSVVRGKVTDLVYLGSLTQVSITLPGGETMVVHRMSNDYDVRSLRPGDAVVATWAPEGAHIIGPAPS